MYYLNIDLTNMVSGYHA